MEDTKEKQEEESEGQVGQYSMEETCGSWFWLVPWMRWMALRVFVRSAAFKSCLNWDKDKKIHKKEENKVEEEADKVEEEVDKVEEEEDKVEEEEVCNIPLENSLTCGVGPRRIPQRPSHTLADPSLQTF